MNDLRTQKTFRSLKLAFLDLLEQHRFEDITVGQLCQRAEIRRATFYNHFADKFEFLSFFIREIRDDMVTCIAQRNPEVEKEAGSYYKNLLHELVVFFQAHPQLVRNLKNSQKLPVMMEIFAESVAQDALHYFHEQGQPEPEEQLELKAHFYAGGILQLLQLWMKDPERFQSDSVNWLNYLT